MTATPLWLCTTIAPGKEQQVHALFGQNGIVALPPLTHKVTYTIHGRRRSKEKILVPGYAFVAHSGAPWMEGDLLRLQWPANGTQVVRTILGHVRDSAIQALTQAAHASSDVPESRKLRPGDKARILLAAGYEREVVITVIKGKRVRILIDGREVETTADRLEAA